MKTQEELIEKLRTELLDKYSDDADCVAEIEECLESGDYKTLIDGYDVDGVRICSECGKLMDEGYCIFDGLWYFCGDECLNKNYNEAQRKELDLGGDWSDSYWTEWYY